MDHTFFRQLKGSVSFIDFKEDTPKHCLDLGTGVSPYPTVPFAGSLRSEHTKIGYSIQLGDWVIDAAKQWTDCTFVSFYRD